MCDKVRQIKMALFPGDDVDIDAALTELANAKFIKRYVVKNERFIEVINFTKHQNPHVKESASTIPAPCKPRARTRRARLIPDSPFLIPESNGGGVPPSDSVESRIWKDGVDLLSRSGMSGPDARTFLGKQAKTFGREKLAEAIAVTQAKNAADPKPFLIAVLQDRLGNGERAKSQVGKYDETEPPRPVEIPTCTEGHEYCLKDHRYDKAPADRG